MAMPSKLSNLKDLLTTDLHGVMRFEVKGGGHDLGDWSHCSGLSVRFDNKVTADLEHNGTTVRPGQPSFGDVKLKRALTHSGAKSVQKWLDHHARKPDSHGETVEIRLLDSWGKTVVEWKLYNVVPKSWSGPDLDGTPSLEAARDGDPRAQSRRLLRAQEGSPDRGPLRGDGGRPIPRSMAQCDGLAVKFDNKEIAVGAPDKLESVPWPGKVKLRRAEAQAADVRARCQARPDLAEEPRHEAPPRGGDRQHQALRHLGQEPGEWASVG